MKILIRNRQRHRPLDKAKVEKAAFSILSLLDQSRYPDTELSILFVSDRIMKQLNRQYRGINRTTDVLSFEARLPSGKRPGQNNILGDIVISVPRAEAQAREYGAAFYDELYRLLIHGTLHLLGYDHEQSSSRAATMRKKEEELLGALTEMD
jgi:probable rRNA maturation factor